MTDEKKIIVDEENDDDVRKMFGDILAQQEDTEEEKIDIKKSKTQFAEYIAPVLALITFVGSFFDRFWFASYFGLIFAGAGIFVCKKREEFQNRAVLLINIISFALCFLMCGFWLILLVLGKM